MNEGLKMSILGEIADLIDSNAYTNGPQVSEFEEAFAKYCGATFCVGVASGLDALRFALLALGLEPGDEVIVPAQTFVATFEAITQARGTPVVVDVGCVDYCIDSTTVEAAITRRTRAIIPVHLYGQLADMRELLRIASKHDLAVVEDACQAHGASRDGVVAGAGGTAAAFSFYPGKNLGAIGDAGALVTDDADVTELARALREHGQRAKYDHVIEGYTSRLDTIQALVLRQKLPLLDAWNDQRRRVARAYGELLDGVGDLVLPPVPEGSEPAWHLYVVQTRDPDRLASHLRRRRIESGRHYPEPPHLTRAYRYLGYSRGAFPVAEELADRCLSLPIFPGMTDEQVERTATAVAAFFDG